MKVLRIVLTAFFSILAATGVGMLIMGKAPTTSAVLVVFYIAVAAALNNKGGKLVLYAAYLCTGVLSLCLFGAIYVVVASLMGDKFETLLFITMLLFSAVGISSIYSIRKGRGGFA